MKRMKFSSAFKFIHHIPKHRARYGGAANVEFRSEVAYQQAKTGRRDAQSVRADFLESGPEWKCQLKVEHALDWEQPFVFGAVALVCWP